MNDAPKTILFLLRNAYYLRNFEAPIRALLDRGHRLVILTDAAKHLPAELARQIASLTAAYPATLSFGDSHGRRDFRRRLADEIHTARDVLRYRTADFAAAASLRRRAIAKATPMARLIYDRDVYADPTRNRLADRRLAAWDASLPADQAISDTLRGIAPDLLVVSPLVDFRSDQIDWVRAAKVLGIPTVLAVASWDNLTNKSRVQIATDRVLVWNETQRREAIELHGIDDQTIVITGAQLYDDWFQRKPSRDREAFCRSLHFDPALPIILYVGSSSAIAANEPAFVRGWLAALRASPDPSLAGANVLIRPHPMNHSGYAALDLAGLGQVTVAPRHGGLPVTEESRADYYDALFHAALLVGLNTSALVEAAILGKPCFTVTASEHRAGQQETLHYRYLTARILHEAPDLDSHFTQLSQALRNDAFGRGGAAAFVADFIRPHGLNEAATPIFVAAIEEALRLTPAAPPPSVPAFAVDTLAIIGQAAYETALFIRSALRAIAAFPSRRAARSDDV